MFLRLAAPLALLAVLTGCPNPPPLTVVESALPEGMVGQPYSAQLQVEGGTTPFTFTITGAPAGLTIASDGQLSGTPTADGDFTLQVTVTDQANKTAQGSLTLKIFPALAVAASALPDGTTGQAYSAQLQSLGGKPPLTFTVTGAPSGVTVASDGTISGTPDADGDFTLAVTVTDARSQTAQRSFPLKVYRPVAFTTTALSDGTTGQAYSAQLQAQGGKPPLTFTVTGAPSGVTVASDGTISGTPDADGDFTLAVTVTDSANRTAQGSLALKVYPPVALTTAALPDGTTGQAYSVQLLAQGGRPPLTFTATGAPSGVTVALDGQISGTPDAAGDFTLQITITDSANRTAQGSLSLMVYRPVSFTSTSLSDGTTGEAYSAQLQAQGGKPPLTFTVTGAPAGVSVASDGQISGAPSAAGDFTLQVTVTDVANRTAQGSLTLAVYRPVSFTSTSLSDGTAGHAYSAQIQAQGGKPPLTITATGIPAGLSVGTNGQLSGTPSAAGDFSLQVTATDSANRMAQGAFGLKVFPSVGFALSSLPEGTVGSTYSLSVATTGGKPPVTVALTSGTLPSGLSFSSGTIAGTPDTPDSAQLTFVATDANGATATTSLQLRVARPLSITTTSLSDGYTGRTYSAAFASDGGSGPFTWSIAAGALPAGLSLAADGALTGSPTSTGLASLTVSVQDAAGRTATLPLTLEVFAPPLLTATPCHDGYRTESYLARWAASGGKAPLGWTLTTGALPGGLSLNATTGEISGTASATGSFSFAITVADANGITSSSSCRIDVYDLPAITTASPLADMTVGASESGSFSAIGGKAPLAWTAIGSLPAGLTLDAQGAYSGTVASSVANAQAFSFDVEVADANGRRHRRPFAVTAYRTPTIDTASLADATEYAAYAPVTIQARDGKAPLAYAITGLPNGLSLNTATGVLSGTLPPNSRGAYPLSVTVTDAGGRTATTGLNLTVRPGTPAIASVIPDFGTVSGGTRVTLSGANLFGARITVGGQAVNGTVSSDGTSVDFTIPAGSEPGTVVISLANSSDLGATSAFTYTLERTIDANGTSGDWTPAFRIGSNAAPGGTPGLDLDALYAAYDADNLYVAVSGPTSQTGGNTLLLFIDIDPGSGSGLTDFSTLLDNNGDLDAACTNDGTGTGQYVRANTRFAPEFCAGTKDFQTVPLGSNWPTNEVAGLRGLGNPSDFPWIVDYQGRSLVAVATGIDSSGFAEFLFPWAVLYPGSGAPPLGAKVALVARLVDATGNLIADQTLPQDDDLNPHRLSQLAEVDVRITPPGGPAPWYQGSVFYELFVRSFQDSNGDGHGDLAGLVSRLDHLNDGNPATTTDLGVDALWLMPIFESPSVHGYDVSNYDQVEADYGSIAGFQALIAQARQRGMRVYLNLVLNHTSDQHPWFIESAGSTTSPRRDWYVWSPTDLGWTQPWSTSPVWHPRDGAYYYGLLWSGMPDLNYRTAAVRDEMKRVATQWLQLGADGYRLDATPYLVEDGPGAGQLHRDGTHQFLRELRTHVSTVNADAALLAENWTDTPTIARYYGSRTVRGGDGVQMNHNFPLSDRIIEALISESASGISSKLVELRAAYPVGAVDAPFLTTHDMTRLSTQVGTDPSRLRLAAALLLTFPGAPSIYYGEEVGAENHFFITDDSKRAPMAWDDTGGGGFTTGSPWFPFAPGQATANVASQTGDPTSLLSRYRQLIRARKGSQALSRGQGLEVLTPVYGYAPLLVFIRSHGAERVVVAHNLSSTPVTSAPYPIRAGSLETLFADPGTSATGATGAWTLTLPARGSAIWRERP